MFDDFFIKPANGDEVNITQSVQNLKFLGIETAPSYVNTYQTIVGIDGSQIQATDIAKTQLKANFWLTFDDYQDLLLAQHEIYRFFGTKQVLRIRTSTRPGLCAFCLPNNFEIKPTQPSSHTALFTIPFDNPSGRFYSLLRSDQLTTASDELMAGMNLPKESLNYHFNTNNFNVYNASDLAIDPYYQHSDLRISLKFSGSYCGIQNNTNGSEWKYNDSSNNQDEIVIDGINTTKNGQACSLSTDYGHVVLNPGWNSITIWGASAIDITFSFPFVYMF